VRIRVDLEELAQTRDDWVMIWIQSAINQILIGIFSFYGVFWGFFPRTKCKYSKMQSEPQGTFTLSAETVKL